MRSFSLAVAAAIGLLVTPSQVSAAGGPQNVSRVSFVSGSVRETFISTSTGGIEDVALTRPTFAGLQRLRAQTRKRAIAFAHGKFVDPTDPHGDLVPGLREMRRQWNRMQVRYQDAPAGSRIRYTTNDPVMVEALHQWFAARAVRKL